MPKDWRSFKPTVSAESWTRIVQYIEDAQTDTELSDYPSVSSWYEMASILSMYENGVPADSKYDDLIKDYKMYLEATK